MQLVQQKLNINLNFRLNNKENWLSLVIVCHKLDFYKWFKKIRFMLLN